MITVTWFMGNMLLNLLVSIFLVSAPSTFSVLEGTEYAHQSLTDEQ
jgi:hypothetical protein